MVVEMNDNGSHMTCSSSYFSKARVTLMFIKIKCFSADESEVVFTADVIQPVVLALRVS